MSSLVVFSTSTGNTRKIADAIFSALKDTDKKIVDVHTKRIWKMLKGYLKDFKIKNKNKGDKL